MHAHTSYTAWFDLQKRSLKRASPRLGRVQLRYSLSWRAPRRRLLAHLAPPRALEVPLRHDLPQCTATQAAQPVGKCPLAV
eukprot:Transcript_19239.p3 GENE.Transcript_19239~~Transcript_19239.p3  ORF type:complete len:81 (-),score=22.49 Transcript_19239:64-306(-)